MKYMVAITVTHRFYQDAYFLYPTFVQAIRLGWSPKLSKDKPFVIVERHFLRIFIHH